MAHEPMTLRKLCAKLQKRDGNDTALDLPLTFIVRDGHQRAETTTPMPSDVWPTTFRGYGVEGGYVGELRFDVFIGENRLVKDRRRS